MKLWPYRAIQDRWFRVESSDKMWSTGGGSGKPFQYSCHENPMNMNSMKKQKYMTSQNKSPKLEGIQYATGEEQRAITNSSRKNKSRNNAQL